MTFQWNSFLLLAEYLNNGVDNITGIDREAAFRTAISRAYYAAFNVAKNYAEKEFHSTGKNGSGSHDKLINLYKEFGAEKKEYRMISTQLDRIKRNRTDADYRLNFKDQARPAYKACLTIKTSQNIIDLINNIKNP
jgi:uncharacterized protein (UPF0332 family)